MIQFGVDVARQGGDLSVCAIRHDFRIIEIDTWSKSDIVESAERVERLHGRHKADAIVIDADGLGAGVFDILKRKELPVIAFHGSSKTDRLDDTQENGFLNLRAYAWWNLRSLLHPTLGMRVVFPKHDSELVAAITGDLCAPKWWIVSGSRIQVEPKDDIRKRLGRSPDIGDALAYCFVDMSVGEYEKDYSVLSGQQVSEMLAQEPEAEECRELTPAELEQMLWRGARLNCDVMDW